MPRRFRGKVAGAVRWSAAEGLVNGLVGVATIFVLALLLGPADIGRAGIALSFVALVEIVVGLGMVEALVGTRSADTRVSDTAFATVMAGAAVGSAAMIFLAGPIAHVYAEPGLEALILTATMLLPINALLVVPTGLFTRKMRARALTLRMLIGRVGTLLATALLGFLGYGPWAIVFGTLIGQGLSLILVLTMLTRIPRLRFHVMEFRGLVAFGSLLGLERLLWSSLIRVFWLLVGYLHGASVLGYFQFGQRLIEETANLLQTFAMRFGLAFFASLERAGGATSEAFLKATRVITAVGAPIFVGLALVLPDLLRVLFDPRWLPAAIVCQIAALGWATALPRIMLAPALRAQNRQVGMVVYAAIASTLTLIAAGLTGGHGLALIALAFMTRHLVGIPWSAFAMKRYLGIGAGRQADAILRPLAATIPMSALVLATQAYLVDSSPVLRLAAMVGTGVIAYAVALALIDRPTIRLSRKFAGMLRSR